LSICGMVSNLGNIPDVLKEPCGVFVTLTKRGELRGCVGYVESIAPMYKAVIECAQSAAYRDFRFMPVQKDEISSLDIEISILTKPESLGCRSPEDLLTKLNKNFGVVIKKGRHQATFLPQVWEELPDKKEFLSHLCLKAGLDPDAWKQGGLEVSVYTVEKFSEK
jgi:AmmeMemoRadiSam system protein A